MFQELKTFQFCKILTSRYSTCRQTCTQHSCPTLYENITGTVKKMNSLASLVSKLFDRALHVAQGTEMRLDEEALLKQH